MMNFIAVIAPGRFPAEREDAASWWLVLNRLDRLSVQSAMIGLPRDSILEELEANQRLAVFDNQLTISPLGKSTL